MKLNEAFSTYQSLILNSASSADQNIEAGRWKNHIANFFGDTELESIKSIDILRFQTHLNNKNLSHQSVHHCLSLVRRVLNRAVE